MGLIEQRLEHLEQTCRRSRRLNQLLSLVLVAFACIGAAQTDIQKSASQGADKQKISPGRRHQAPARSSDKDHFRSIEANELRLVDSRGRSRIKMTVSDEGPVICLFDEAGQRRVELSESSGQSGFRLFAKNESPCVSLYMHHNNEAARLEIEGVDGKSVIRPDGFFVHDSDGHSRLNLALLNGNYPVLGINQSGQNGPPSIEFTAQKSSRSIKLHDSEGRPLASLTASENGSSILDMRHPDGDRSIQISSGEKEQAGPSIDFLVPAKDGGDGGILPRLKIGLDKESEPFTRGVCNCERRDE